MRIDVYFHTEDRVESKLDQILAIINRTEGKVDNMNQVLADALAKITEQSTLTASLIELFKAQNASLEEFLAGKLSDEDLAAAQAILTTSTADVQKIADALVSNTPLEAASKKK